MQAEADGGNYSSLTREHVGSDASITKFAAQREHERGDGNPPAAPGKEGSEAFAGTGRRPLSVSSEQDVVMDEQSGARPDCDDPSDGEAASDESLGRCRQSPGDNASRDGAENDIPASSPSPAPAVEGAAASTGTSPPFPVRRRASARSSLPALARARSANRGNDGGAAGRRMTLQALVGGSHRRSSIVPPGRAPDAVSQAIVDASESAVETRAAAGGGEQRSSIASIRRRLSVLGNSGDIYDGECHDAHNGDDADQTEEPEIPPLTMTVEVGGVTRMKRPPRGLTLICCFVTPELCATLSPGHALPCSQLDEIGLAARTCKL